MAERATSSPRVLIVATDRQLRSKLSEELGGAATTLFAESGADAIAFLTVIPEIAAVIAELDLGVGPDGFEVLVAARVQCPKSVRCVVTTGDHAFVAVQSDVVHIVFARPWLPGVVGRYLAQHIPKAAS